VRGAAARHGVAARAAPAERPLEDFFLVVVNASEGPGACAACGHAEGEAAAGGAETTLQWHSRGNHFTKAFSRCRPRTDLTAYKGGTADEAGEGGCSPPLKAAIAARRSAPAASPPASGGIGTVYTFSCSVTCRCRFRYAAHNG